MILAAPHCTLWVADLNRDCFWFRFWPSLVVTRVQYVMARLA